MEPAYGVMYLLLFALVFVLGLPIVWVCTKIWGQDDERTGAIYTVLLLAMLGAAWRWG